LNNRAVEIQSQDPEEALRLYNDAVEADPEYWLGYVNKAQLLLQDKKYAEAASCFETLSALRPRAAEYYVGHAFCLHRLGKEGRVRDLLLHAISAYNYRMQTEDPPFHARLNRAMVLFLMGREYVAMSELEELTGQNDTSDQMVSALREAMEKASSKDRWSILGLDD
jgi:tetratricopeptide (TPR) repeat protein